MHVPNAPLRKANITAIFHLSLIVLIIYPSLELLLVQKLEILCRCRLTYLNTGFITPVAHVLANQMFLHPSITPYCSLVVL